VSFGQVGSPVAEQRPGDGVEHIADAVEKRLGGGFGRSVARPDGGVGDHDDTGGK